MRYGYARVSTTEQNCDLQLKALDEAGCSRVFQDVITGKSRRRPGLDRLLAKLKPGDTVVIWRVDRLGRSFYHLVLVAEQIRARGANIVSLTEGLDTASTFGEVIYRMMCIFAEVEHKGIVERTRAGLAAARARGVKLGRRRRMTSKQALEAATLLAAGMSGKVCAARYGVGRSTLYRELSNASRAIAA